MVSRRLVLFKAAFWFGFRVKNTDVCRILAFLQFYSVLLVVQISLYLL
jgi:hypothetical protein